MTMLHPGDSFPDLAVTNTEDGLLQLPISLAGHFGVVLFYRGSWCPYCNTQLSAFQRAQEDLDGVDARVIALSVDDEATTKALIAKRGREFPVGRSASARAVRRRSLTTIWSTSSPRGLCSTPPVGSS